MWTGGCACCSRSIRATTTSSAGDKDYRAARPRRPARPSTWTTATARARCWRPGPPPRSATTASCAAIIGTTGRWRTNGSGTTPEAGLLDLVTEMADSAHFDYDVVSYTVGSDGRRPYAGYYGSPCYGCGGTTATAGSASGSSSVDRTATAIRSSTIRSTAIPSTTIRSTTASTGATTVASATPASATRSATAIAVPSTRTGARPEDSFSSVPLRRRPSCCRVSVRPRATSA